MNGKPPLWTVILALLVSPAYAVDTAIPFIQADQVHGLGILGQKVVVAVLDFGVDYGHADLQGKMAPRGRTYRYGSVVGGEGAASPGDDHGTVVALEIVAGGTHPGVAPAAKILSVRVLHSTGASWLDVRKGIEYVTRQKQPWLTPGIRIINLSLGSGAWDCPCDNLVSGELVKVRDAIQRAKDAGILTVACTGNDSYCWSTWAPACLSEVLAVPASYDDAPYPSIINFGVCQDLAPQPRRVTCFSNYDYCGGGHALAAPGYDIDVGGFQDWWGTSMATPLVSGVAALRYSKWGCRAEAPDVMQMVLISQGDVIPYGALHCPDTPPTHVNAWRAVMYGTLLETEPGTGDMDCDGQVCAYDFPPFEECMTGPGAGPVMGFCLEGDFGSSPPDGDVDLRDLHQFQLAFEGFGSGACCHPDGTCSVVSMYDCAAETGALYQGNDSTCAEVDCVITRYSNSIDPLESYKSAGAGLMLGDDITLNGSGGGMLSRYWLLVYGGGGGTFDVTVQLYTGCPGEGGTPIAGTEHTFYGNPDGAPVDLVAEFDPPVYIPHDVWMVASFSNPQAGWFIAEEAETGYTEDWFGRYDPPWQCQLWHGPSGPYCGMWAMIECGKVTGACCLPDESCIEGTEDECAAVSGVYQGHGTLCSQVNCSQTSGACCRPDGTCVEVTESECDALGGTFHVQTSCAAVDCMPERYSNTLDPPYGYATPDPGYQFADDMTLAGYGAGNLIHYDVKVCRPSGGTFDVTASLHTACPPSSGNQIAGTTYSWNSLAPGMYHTLNADFPPVLVSGTVWLRLQFSALDAGWVVAEQAEIGSTQDRFGVAIPSWGCYYSFGGSPWGGFWANLTFGGGDDLGPGEPITWVESVVPTVPPMRLYPDVYEVDHETILDELPLPYDGDTRLLGARRARYSAGLGDSRSATVTLELYSSVAGQTIEAGAPVDWALYAEVSTGDNSGLALLGADLVQDAGNPESLDIPPASQIGPLMESFDRPAGISNPGTQGSAFGGTPLGPAGSADLIQIGGSQNTFGMEGYETGLDVDVDPGVGQSGPTLIASGSFAAPDTHGLYTFRVENAFANVLDAVGTPPAHSPVSPATVDATPAEFSFTVRRAVCRGDMNCDGFIDFDDINPFILSLSNWPEWLARYPECPPENADINGDGLYGGELGFGDINPFSDLIASGGGNPIPCP